MEYEYKFVRVWARFWAYAKVRIVLIIADADSVIDGLPSEIDKYGAEINAKNSPDFVAAAIAGVQHVLTETTAFRTERYCVVLTSIEESRVDTDADTVWMAAACCIWEALYPEGPSLEKVLFDGWD